MYEEALHLMSLSQVYFVQDPHDPDRQVVVDVEPRARRIAADSSEERLSAPGRADATVNISRGVFSEGQGHEFVTVPVRDVNVAHVLAQEERDEEADHAEMDFDDVPNKEADNNDEPDEESQYLVPPPGLLSLVLKVCNVH